MKRSLVLVMWLTAMCTGAYASPPPKDRACVERFEDGAWYEVGRSSPSEAVLADAFESGGMAAMQQLLGEPERESVEEAVWIYEKRSEYVAIHCNPPHFLREYVQFFRIVRVGRDGAGAKCAVEYKMLIGKAPIPVEQALASPPTPLDSPPRKCGSGGK